VPKINCTGPIKTNAKISSTTADRPKEHIACTDKEHIKDTVIPFSEVAASEGDTPGGTSSSSFADANCTIVGGHLHEHYTSKHIVATSTASLLFAQIKRTDKETPAMTTATI
jgi:hypothetical protein